MSSPRLTEFQGQPALALKAPCGARAVVLLHGGHLVSWTPAGEDEQLYLSPTSRYGDGASVRGGVPVIFPQFNERGPLPRHGLARTRRWQAVESVVRGDHAIGVLRLVDDASTHAHWPHSFEVELTVSIAGKTLDLELAVTNTGHATFDFQAALHTYLRCNDVLKAQLEGLQHVDYEDAVRHETGRQWGDVVSVVGPLDRVYRDVQRPLTLRELGRRVQISQREFNDLVVWNPGEEGNSKLSDMPAGDWQAMLCVEAAQIETPVRLAPGQDWAGMQSLSV